ncbi:MAG TPA: hypothetical protein DEP65_08470 [Ruminococcus sp.]|nr:hypothetical protein [Ruminococcus sp.]
MNNNEAEMNEGLSTQSKIKRLPMSVPLHMMTYRHHNLTQPEHSHIFFELGYLREGSIIHSFSGKSAYAEEGDYFIIDIGDFHSYKSSKTDDCIVMQNCLFFPTVIDNSLRNCGSFKEMISSYPLNIEWDMLKENPTSTVFHDETGEIGVLLNMLQAESNARDCHSQILKGLLSTILIKTMKKIAATDLNSSDRITNVILKYAAEHYSEDNILTLLSHEIHYSLPYLSSVFKKETGVSFKEHIQKLRIDAACRLLISSNYKIYYISSLVGYKSETQFHKTFMELTGTTPKKYREKMRNMNNF